MEMIGILGTTRVQGPWSTEHDLGGTKPRQVLELLALHHGRLVSKKQLAAWLWPAGPPPAAERTIESHVAVVRRRLQAAGLSRTLVVTVPAGYMLSREATCDLTTFQAVAARGDAAAALRLLDDRQEVTAAPLLAASAEHDWADQARSTWRETRADLHLLAGSHALAVGRPASASWHGAHAEALRPLGEAPVRLRMSALAQLGEPALAIGAYLDLRDRLRAELGIEPSRLTTQAYLALLGTSAPTLADRTERALVLRLYDGLADRGPAPAGAPAPRVPRQRRALSSR